MNEECVLCCMGDHVCGMRLPAQVVSKLPLLDGQRAIFVLLHGMVMLAVDLIFCPPTIPKIYILETHSRVYTDAHGQFVCSVPLLLQTFENNALLRLAV